MFRRPLGQSASASAGGSYRLEVADGIEAEVEGDAEGEADTVDAGADVPLETALAVGNSAGGLTLAVASGPPPCGDAQAALPTARAFRRMARSGRVCMPRLYNGVCYLRPASRTAAISASREAS